MSARRFFQKIRFLAVCIPLAMGTAVQAVEPDELLSDPALEERAREISKDLRCLVCRNESIDESNADLARDLRVLVRERLSEGDSNAEVLDFVVARYGEYVLLRPTTRGANWLLWASGPLMLVLAGGIGLAFVRRRSRSQPAGADTLTEDEKARLAEILKE